VHEDGAAERGENAGKGYEDGNSTLIYNILTVMWYRCDAIVEAAVVAVRQFLSWS
jgi:hypothetical protein